MLEQPTADDGPHRDSDSGARTPEPDRASTLAALGEDVGQQRQGCREDQRRAEPHHRTSGDELPGAVAQAAGEARCSEHHEAGKEHALPADAIAKVSRREHERREHEVVGVDDPFELDCRRAELSHERRQRDVDDRRVEADRERREHKRRQNQRFSVVATGIQHRHPQTGDGPRSTERRADGSRSSVRRGGVRERFLRHTRCDRPRRLARDS
jgi:hypothetical protein